MRAGAFRIALSVGVVTALLVLARPSPLEVTAGFLVAATGEALRIWAAGHLSRPPELVTSGPYAHLRHPLFLGRVLIFAGLCLATRLPWGANAAIFALGSVWLLAFELPRKERSEAERLTSRYGEAYTRYRAEVPAMFPSLSPRDVGATSIGWSSDRLVRNREPWVLLGIVAVTLVLLWRAYRSTSSALEPVPSPVSSRVVVSGSNWSA